MEKIFLFPPGARLTRGFFGRSPQQDIVGDVSFATIC
jgi:hypothetical protein